MTKYEMLGVATSANADEIRQVYLVATQRLTAQRDHAATPGETEAIQEQLTLLDTAWETLSDPGRRTEYDRSIGLAAPGAPPPPVRVSRQMAVDEDVRNPTGMRSDVRLFDGLLPSMEQVQRDAEALQQLPPERLRTGIALIVAMVLVTVLVLLLAHLGRL